MACELRDGWLTWAQRTERGWRTVNDAYGHVPSLPTHGQSYVSLPPIALMAIRSHSGGALCMSPEEVNVERARVLFDLVAVHSPIARSTS